MRYLYWAYVNVFRCLCRVRRALWEEASKPIELKDSKWLSVDAHVYDGSIVDITDQMRNVFRGDAFLTPSKIENALRMDNVESYHYLTTTLEYNKIEADGIVNGL